MLILLFTEVDEVPQEEAEVEIVEQAVFQEEEIQDTVEESLIQSQL